jgi:hypothetical protein
VLEVDARERGWQLAQVARGRADEAARLPERPVGQRDRLCAAGHDQSETLGTVTACLDAYRPGLDRTPRRALGAGASRGVKGAQREKTLIVRAGKAFGPNTPDPIAAADVDLIPRRNRARRRDRVGPQSHIDHDRASVTDRPRASLDLSNPSPAKHQRSYFDLGIAPGNAPRRRGGGRPRRGSIGEPYSRTNCQTCLAGPSRSSSKRRRTARLGTKKE